MEMLHEVELKTRNEDGPDIWSSSLQKDLPILDSWESHHSPRRRGDWSQSTRQPSVSGCAARTRGHSFQPSERRFLLHLHLPTDRIYVPPSLCLSFRRSIYQKHQIEPHLHASIRPSIHPAIHAHLSSYLSCYLASELYVDTHICMYGYACMHVCTHVCMHVCVCAPLLGMLYARGHACMHVCMSVCMYVYDHDRRHARTSVRVVCMPVCVGLHKGMHARMELM